MIIYKVFYPSGERFLFKADYIKLAPHIYKGGIVPYFFVNDPVWGVRFLPLDPRVVILEGDLEGDEPVAYNPRKPEILDFVSQDVLDWMTKHPEWPPSVLFWQFPFKLGVIP